MGETTVKKRITAEKICLIACFVAWFVFNLILCINHEAFRDEAQSWFIAKDNSIPGMIGFMWQEGHPWLFHLLLWPFAHIGIPFVCMKYVCLAIATAAMYLYVSRSPFPMPVTCTTLFLPFINYYATAFARPYCILLLGCMLIGASWKDREHRPWLTCLSLAVLGCSHIICVIPALLLFIYLSAENASRGVWKASGYLAFIIPMFIFYIPLVPQFIRVFETIGLPAWTLIPCIFVGIAIVAGGIVFVTARYRKRKTPSVKRFKIHSVLMSFVTVATAIVTCFVLTSMTETAIMVWRYTYCSIPIFLSCMWIMCEEQKEIYGEKRAAKSGLHAAIKLGMLTEAVVFACVVLGFTGGYEQMMQDIKYPYSTGETVAEYINENIGSDAVILAGHQGCDTTVALFLDDEHHLTVPQTGSVLHYTKWFDEWETVVPTEKWKQMLSEYTEKHETVYLLVSDACDFEDFYDWMFEKLDTGEIEIEYKTHPIKDKDRFAAVDIAEAYILLKINGGNFNE